MKSDAPIWFRFLISSPSALLCFIGSFLLVIAPTVLAVPGELRGPRREDGEFGMRQSMAALRSPSAGRGCVSCFTLPPKGRASLNHMCAEADRLT